MVEVNVCHNGQNLMIFLSVNERVKGIWEGDNKKPR